MKHMYSELKAKSYYSFLQAASSPEELMDVAAERGLSALGLCDVNGVYGIPKAYWRRKHHHSKLKLLVGAELSIEKLPPITLIAQNKSGYSLLCKIITQAFQDKEKGQASLSLEQLTSITQEKSNEDLFCLSLAHPQLKGLKTLFKEKLFLSLSRHLNGHDKENTRLTLQSSEEHCIPIVATNDVLFAKSEKKQLHDVLTAIHQKKGLNDLGFRLGPNAERFIKSPSQMRELFHDLPEAINNTLLISESCDFCPSQLRYQYPDEWLPKGISAQEFLEQLTWKGAKRRYKENIPLKVKTQLIHELHLINELSFADYFLTIYDIVDYAQKKDILCQGRGSAANSAICFCLGITAIDPVAMNLLFERFISAERGEPPDIDVDFEHERREEVIQHIYEKYGRNKAAMVCTMITYRKRSALRDVAKAFHIPIGTLSARKVEKQMTELCKESPIPDSQSKVAQLCEEISDLPRHPGVHSGGFILSSKDLSEIVPIEPARMPGRTVIQWDKYDLDYLGLLKVDILSLGMLSALKKSLKMTGKELYEIPHDDTKTYEMIQQADTVGTFQIESRAQMSMLGRLKPKNFYDLVVEVAIVRPGPIVGQMVHPYLKRRQGLEKVEYHHPQLKKILEKTLGVPLFQEQVMKIAIEVAGFTAGEANELRQSIAAWRSEGSINKMAQRLFYGLRKQGIPEEFCHRIYKQIYGFSKYGFPESHAASFALLAYASCYLKCHHPSEFTCSLLNSQPMGFYATHTLVDDAKRHGVKVLAVHPNFSNWDSHITGSAIQLGWRIVKGLGKKDGELIAQAKPYADLKDFVTRTSLRKDLLYRLALAGCFDCWKLDRRHTLWSLLKDLPETQVPFFQFANSNKGKQVDLFQDFDEVEKTALDFEAYRLTTRGHPMEFLRKRYKTKALNSRQAKLKKHGTWIRAAGLNLVLQKPPTAKGVAFSTLEDEHGFLDLVIHPQVYEDYKEAYYHEAFLIIEGRLQRDRNTCNVLVKKIIPLLKDKKELPLEPNRFFH